MTKILHVCIVIYVDAFDISCDEALQDLFYIPHEKIMCVKCNEESGVINSINSVDYYNYKQVQSSLNQEWLWGETDLEDIEGASDDSLCDPDYARPSGQDMLQSSQESSVSNKPSIEMSDSIELLSLDKELRISNPFLSPDSSIDRLSCISNPFKESGGSGDELFRPVVHSTVYDFSEDCDGLTKFVKKRKVVSCDHCSKDFSNRYNMKLHLIRY